MVVSAFPPAAIAVISKILHHSNRTQPRFLENFPDECQKLADEPFAE